MGTKTATFHWMVMCAMVLMTAVTSKPVSLNTAAEESDSVESNSSEESVAQEEEEEEEVEQPESTITESTVTDAPNVVDQTEPPATIALPAALEPSALPSEALDPQTSADALQIIPDDPSQTPLGVDVSQDMPETDPAHDAVNPDQLAPNADVAIKGIATDSPQANDIAIHRELLPVATPYPPYVMGKSTHVSVVNAVPVHVGPGVPVCFTFQYAAHYTAPEYKQPRGDSY